MLSYLAVSVINGLCVVISKYRLDTNAIGDFVAWLVSSYSVSRTHDSFEKRMT